MATEKRITTRILNKIDTLENWQSSTLQLKKGEICIATVAASVGTGLTEPVCMIKVATEDGKTFSELPWSMYAKASDVIESCKSEPGLTAFVNNVINNAGLATDATMNALTARVTAAEGDIDALEALVGDTAVATQISDAIATLNLANTYDAKGAAAAVQNSLDSYKTSNNAVIEAIKDGAVIDSFKDVEDQLATKDAKGAAAQALADAKEYADGKDAAIAAAKKAGDDAQADVDALEAAVGTVPTGKTVVQMISEAQTAATYDDTGVKADIAQNAADIAALETLVGDTAVATQISTAVANAKTELKGSTSDNANSATIAGVKKYADSLDAAMDARVDALEAAVGEGGSVGAQIDEKIAALDVADTAVAGQYVSAVSETDGKITVTRAALPDYTETYAAKVHGHAIADVTGLQTELDKVTTLIGSDANKSVRTIANEELAAQLIPDGAKESLDTLQEIANWIQDHPDDAAAMNTAIEALEAKVGDTSVSAQVTAAIDALKIGDYAKVSDLTAAASRIATNENAIATLNGTGEGSVSKTVSDAVAALDVEDTAVEHQFVTAVSETDGKIVVSRSAITTDDLEQGTLVWVFDCGNSSV